MNRLYLPVRLYQRVLQPVNLLLLAFGCNKIPLAPPALLLFDDSLDTLDFFDIVIVPAF